MSTIFKTALALLLSTFLLTTAFCQQAAIKHKKIAGNANGSAELWLTDPTDSVLFKKEKVVQSGASNQSPTIKINKLQAYQSIDGFGYALTGGSAMLINKMTPAGRAKLLYELFTTQGNSIGVSYLRISVGSSDLDDHVFSYDDLQKGETDPELKKFSLVNDEGNLIPVLKQILAINPKIKILISPWSPPVWMKTNGETFGGNLKPEYYKTYAQYFVKYIKGMAARA